MMKTALPFLIALIFITSLPTGAFAATPSEIHIKPDGTFTATNVVVFQKAGDRNFFCRVMWDKVYVRVVVLVNDSTVITKKHGERATGKDIQEGDVLDVEGVLTGGEGSFNVMAKKVRDNSLTAESKSITGSVLSIDSGKNSFVLKNKTFGTTTVSVTGTTTIQKGVRTIPFSEIVKGDEITSTHGTYNYTTRTLAASLITVYQNPALFQTKLYEGTLKSIAGTTFPTSLVVSVGGTDYTVFLSEKTIIYNRARDITSLTRFVVGDSIRLNGKLRQTNLTEIDATVVRDTNF
jgi:hypothetical protein